MADYLKDQRKYVYLQLKDLNNDWREQKNCGGMDPSDFFERFENGSYPFRNKIIATCNSCPVRKECLSFGMETGSSGVWGGEYLGKGKVVKDAYSVGSNGRPKKKVSLDKAS